MRAARGWRDAAWRKLCCLKSHLYPPPPSFTLPAQEFTAVLRTAIDATGAYSQHNPEWAATSKKQGVATKALPPWLADEAKK